MARTKNKKAECVKMMRDASKHSYSVENFNDEKMFYGDVFRYAANCERNFERNLREDYKRKTTFTSDLSIAEWYASVEGLHASVTDTLVRCVESWLDSIEFFCELIIATNMKSWEHHARKHPQWAEYYADMYYILKDIFFTYYEGNDNAMQYYYDYVD